MGGGTALREVRRACGSKRPLRTGLVLTAIALAAAGAVTQMSGMSGDGGYKTETEVGAAGATRNACGTSLDDGGIH